MTKRIKIISVKTFADVLHVAIKPSSRRDALIRELRKYEKG
jgi:predicted ATP-dependent protease